MKLIIDSRENSVFYKAVITECIKLNIMTEQQWLEIGDYVFQDVCFEAKSSIDFLQSVINKRLWNQLDNMDRHYEHNILIIHGSLHEALSYGKYTGVHMPEQMIRNKFFGALGKITLDTDCKIFWAEGPVKAARMLTTICKMRPLDRAVIKPSLLKRITTEDLRLNMLGSIKGVSEMKAQQLLDDFGSIMEIGEATVDELITLDGIGKVTAQRIIDVLNSEDKVMI
jgi:ERCC4-type nuclease